MTLLLIYLLSQAPVNTYREVPNNLGGAYYYSKSGQRIGYSQSNNLGGKKYYDNKGQYSYSRKSNTGTHYYRSRGK